MLTDKTGHRNDEKIGKSNNPYKLKLKINRKAEAVIIILLHDEINNNNNKNVIFHYHQ